MSEADRTAARRLCSEAVARGEPLSWFEEVYERASGDPTAVPWADLEPNPHLRDWHAATRFDFAGKECLKIGCGLGDDCEYLRAKGGCVTGFDVSATAIAWCKTRFPESTVDYSVRDLFDAPRSWSRRFQFVLESYTLQVLPPDIRRRSIGKIADFVADGGRLLVVCRLRDPSDPTGRMPWPLTRDEIESFGACGLIQVEYDDFHDNETPPVRRVRALFRRA